MTGAAAMTENLTSMGATVEITPYDAPALETLGRVHFIGMGGAGMSAVARILLAQGLSVSGSDAKDSPSLAELAALGATTYVGHDGANVAAADTLVVSSAIRDTNPELAAARAAGLRILHRSQALAAAMAADTVVAVAGTHGKTTTTSMVTVALRGTGLDPSFAIGGTVPALGVNAGHGSSPIFVAEADESDASFLNYRPRIAVVTNVEPDHLDHYGTAEAVYAAFDAFVSLLPAGGVLVACADDAGAAALAGRAAAAGVRTVTYGYAGTAGIRIADEGASGVHSRSRLTLDDATSNSNSNSTEEVLLELQVPGRHNILNAVAAVAVARELGIPAQRTAAALSGFTGAARRFEAKGTVRGVRVYDDYAHHPTEVAAALRAARTVAGEHRVHVLFQPHLFSRTREFAAEFAHALDLADTVAVLDIYPAREDPVPGVTSELITSALQVPFGYSPDAAAAVERLAGRAAEGDIILTVGAGDVTQYGTALLSALGRTGGTHG